MIDEATVFKVGFREGRDADESRRNWSGDGPRPLNWTLWYPADDGVAESPLFLGPSHSPLFRMGTVARDAPLRGEPALFPVVLISHGTGGSARDLGWLAGRLAASGYVVIGVDHHGNTMTEPYRAEGFLCWWERPRDLSVLLDKLSLTGVLAGRLDLDRVFVAGFSLGGYAALSLLGAMTDIDRFFRWTDGPPGGRRGPREFPDLADEVDPLLARSRVFRDSWRGHSRSCRDARVKAALVLAPAPPVRAFTTGSLEGLQVPVAIAVGGADAEAPPGPCAQWLHAHLPNNRLHELGADVGHYVFLCESTGVGRQTEPDLCRDSIDVSRRLVHDRVATIALETYALTQGAASYRFDALPGR